MIFQNARRLKRSKKSNRDFFDKLMDMPNPLHIASSVAMDGTVLRRKIFAIVDSDRLQFFARRYAVQPLPTSSS